MCSPFDVLLTSEIGHRAIFRPGVHYEILVLILPSAFTRNWPLFFPQGKFAYISVYLLRVFFSLGQTLVAMDAFVKAPPGTQCAVKTWASSRYYWSSCWWILVPVVNGVRWRKA